MSSNGILGIILLQTQTNLLGSTTGSFSTFVMCLIIIIVFLVYRKEAKESRGIRGVGVGEPELPGPDALPGPRAWDPTGIIGHAIQLLPFNKSLDIGLRWSEEYGDVVKVIGLRRNWVTLNSGPLVQALLKSSDMGHITKAPEIYDLMKAFVNNGVLGGKH